MDSNSNPDKFAISLRQTDTKYAFSFVNQQRSGEIAKVEEKTQPLSNNSLMIKLWGPSKEKKKDYKTAEALNLLPEASANYGKIIETLKSIDTTIEKGDVDCKKVLDNHEKQFLLAYRVNICF